MCVQTSHKPEIEVIDDGSDESEDENEAQSSPVANSNVSSPPVDVEECIRSERLFCELEMMSNSKPSSSDVLDLGDVPDLEDVNGEALDEDTILKRVEAKTGITVVDHELEGLD